MESRGLKGKLVEVPEELQELFELYKKDIEAHINISKVKYSLKVEEESSEYVADSGIIEIIKTIPLTETFNELLFKYIDKSGLTDVQVYKSAYVDRKLFSKIRSDKYYHPSFGTVTLLALALKLSTDEYESLLESASYALPKNTYESITIRYCFDNKIYDVHRVNDLVYSVVGKEIREI